MDTKRIMIQGAALAVILMSAACSDDLGLDKRAGERPLTFQVSTASWEAPVTRTAVSDGTSLPVTAIIGDAIEPVRSLNVAGRTRAVEATTAGMEASAKFQVACYISNTKDNFAAGSHLYFNDEVNYAASKWTTAKTRLWQSSGNMKFYAWWPVDAAHVAYTPTANTISYSLDAPNSGELNDDYSGTYAAMTQKDLLYAVSGVTGSSAAADLGAETGGAPLQFKHALTAVQFLTSPKVALEGAVIKTVRIRNVATHGTFNMDTETWTIDESTTGIYTVTPSTGASTVAAGTQPITTGTSTFFMLPQSLSAAAGNNDKRVEVTFEKAGVTSVLTADLAGLPDWEPGQTVKYVLGSKGGDAYIIYAEQTTTPTYEGGTTTLTVNSYMITRDGGNDVQTKVNWKVTGVSIDGGKTFNAINAATWTGTGVAPVTPWLTGLASCSDLTANTPGVAAATTGTLTASHSPVTLEDSRAHEIDLALQAAPTVSNRDLSMYDAKGNALSNRCTANCYVVSAAGTYKFPAVYGNGILNGADNYANCIDSDFRNSVESGVVPTSVNIWEDSNGNGGTLEPATAELLWQQTSYFDYTTSTIKRDAKVIDKNTVSYDPSTHMVSFSTASAANMHQGNAVIALKDADGRILWSWHIWVTSLMAEEDDIPVASGASFAPVAVGTVYQGGLRNYAARGVMLMLEQTDQSGNILADGSTCRIQLQQSSGADADDRAMMNTYYQFGRKDPFPTANGWSGGASILAEGSWTTINTGSAQSLQTAIANPHKFILVASGNWTSGNRYNLWDKGRTTTSTAAAPVHKTIYDPSPYGYHVPHTQDFNVSTFQSSLSLSSAIWSSTGYRGYTWLTGPGETTTIFFPASGYRHHASGALFSVGSIGSYRSVTMSNGLNGYTLYFNYSSVSPQNSSSRAYGWSMRPVRD